ncbi:MAG: class I SAM-dependent methyltransferase, partial [Sphingomonadales bacterium]|nr:class I SAM-dependent methyltransferase [Sphingomonadales bacterium]
MDSVYRGQRHIYDATRKYFLFGRDALINGIKAAAGMRVLEIACGTGRNLDLIARRWPGVSLHGLDISAEMLRSANARLGDNAELVLGDATCFDAKALFGQPAFDRIVLSYSLSMIPDWRAALQHAATLLAPGGSLHVVDFGDAAGLPSPLRWVLEVWLAKFHVTPRPDLSGCAEEIATRS